MIENQELQTACGFICRSVGRVVACLDGLSAEQLNWHPPAEGANSLYAIAVHVLANTEENLLHVLCREPAQGERDAGAHKQEWAATGEAGEPIRQRWALLEERIEQALAALPATEVDREREHPRRGRLTGRDILYVVARHAAEHQGQAELTRDLLKAATQQAPA